MASVRLTGDGRQQADIKKELDYHNAFTRRAYSIVCAGSISAREHCEINYFTGVRRETTMRSWVQKSYGLLDRLQGKPPTGSRRM